MLTELQVLRNQFIHAIQSEDVSDISYTLAVFLAKSDNTPQTWNCIHDTVLMANALLDEYQTESNKQTVKIVVQTGLITALILQGKKQLVDDALTHKNLGKEGLAKQKANELSILLSVLSQLAEIPVAVTTVAVVSSVDVPVVQVESAPSTPTTPAVVVPVAIITVPDATSNTVSTEPVTELTSASQAAAVVVTETQGDQSIAVSANDQAKQSNLPPALTSVTTATTSTTILPTAQVEFSLPPVPAVVSNVTPTTTSVITQPSILPPPLAATSTVVMTLPPPPFDATTQKLLGAEKNNANNNSPVTPTAVSPARAPGRVQIAGALSRLPMLMPTGVAAKPTANSGSSPAPVSAPTTAPAVRTTSVAANRSSNNNNNHALQQPPAPAAKPVAPVVTRTPLPTGSVSSTASLFRDPTKLASPVQKTVVQKFEHISVSELRNKISEQLQGKMNAVILVKAKQLVEELNSNDVDAAKLKACLANLSDNMRDAALIIFDQIDNNAALDQQQKSTQKKALLEDEHFEEYLYYCESTLTALEMGQQKYASILPRICDDCAQHLSNAVTCKVVKKTHADEILDFLTNADYKTIQLSADAKTYYDTFVKRQMDAWFNDLIDTEFRFYDKTQSSLYYMGHIKKEEDAIKKLLGTAYFDEWAKRKEKIETPLSALVHRTCAYTGRVPGTIAESTREVVRKSAV